MYSSYSIAAAVSSCVFAALAIVAVGFRLRARMVQKLKLGSDDWLILVALAFAVSYCCLVLYGSLDAGIGDNLSTLTPDEYANYQKHLYFGVIIAHLSYGFVKLAVLQFYKRIFSVRNFALPANITIFVVIIFMIAATFTSNIKMIRDDKIEKRNRKQRDDNPSDDEPGKSAKIIGKLNHAGLSHKALLGGGRD
ncbi:hypothetical protein F5Y16DRAFT_425356 [Xylariaceae sp. FL0255]|nr:hypothetical protein F5Y16DRAFT_425356 [Xylariaceae sp. FL0255]